MAIPKKGLRDIRTVAGKVGGALSYKTYMQVTCLEMEKVRRQRERRSASQRVADIDARLREIETEKAALLQVAGEQSRGELPGPAVNRPTPGPASRRLRLRY